MPIPTPSYSHVFKFPNVYEPSEDTFILLDALESEESFLRDLKPTVALEVGCGSGVVTTFLGSILQSSALYMCTDRNPSAALCARTTADVNERTFDVVVTDLVHGLLPQMCKIVDVLIFNPPYVSTPSEEISAGGISAAWAGGVDGREVMDRLFPLIPKLLSPKGVFYLVTVETNKTEEISKLLENLGFNFVSVLTRRSGLERLTVNKIFRKTDVS